MYISTRTGILIVVGGQCLPVILLRALWRVLTHCMWLRPCQFFIGSCHALLTLGIDIVHSSHISVSVVL
jgi:hypothetical protein